MVSPGTFVLPPIVARCLQAINEHDLSSLLRTFAADAIVNDQLQDWRGTDAIAEWARRDVLAEQLTLRAVNCLEHHGHAVVLAYADGLFDKRGLPDPLEVHLYFTLAEDRIVQLILLMNRSGTSRFDALLHEP